MSKAVKFALRALVVATALPLIAVALTPLAPARSPYLSSLSNLMVGEVLAKPSCTNKGCNGSGSCGHNAGTNCSAPGAPIHCSSTTC